MNKKTVLLGSLLLFLFACGEKKQVEEAPPASQVNTQSKEEDSQATSRSEGTSEEVVSEDISLNSQELIYTNNDPSLMLDLLITKAIEKEMNENITTEKEYSSMSIFKRRAINEYYLNVASRIGLEITEDELLDLYEMVKVDLGGLPFDEARETLSAALLEEKVNEQKSIILNDISVKYGILNKVTSIYEDTPKGPEGINSSTLELDQYELELVNNNPEDHFQLLLAKATELEAVNADLGANYKVAIIEQGRRATTGLYIETLVRDNTNVSDEEVLELYEASKENLDNQSFEAVKEDLRGYIFSNRVNINRQAILNDIILRNGIEERLAYYKNLNSN